MANEQVMGLLTNIKAYEYEGANKASFTIDGQEYNVPKNQPGIIQEFHDGVFKEGARVIVEYRVWKNKGKEHFLCEGIEQTEPPDEGEAPPSNSSTGVHAGPDGYTIGATCGSILNAEMAYKGDMKKIDWGVVEETIILALLLRQRVEKRIADGELEEEVPF